MNTFDETLMSAVLYYSVVSWLDSVESKGREMRHMDVEMIG